VAQVRAWVEHPFDIVNNLFRHKKLRYRGLAKNTAQLHSVRPGHSDDRQEDAARASPGMRTRILPIPEQYTNIDALLGSDLEILSTESAAPRSAILKNTPRPSCHPADAIVQYFPKGRAGSNAGKGRSKG